MPTNKNVNIREAAERLGVDYTTIQAWLKETDKDGHPACPFGWAVKGKKTYRYIIPRARFEAYTSGKDLLYAAVKQLIEQIQKTSA